MANAGTVRMLGRNGRYVLSVKVLWIITVFLIFVSCTQVMEYDPRYLDQQEVIVSRRLNGKCVISTTNTDDDYVFYGPPASALGSAFKLKIPLGLITKNAAIHVFESVCTEVEATDNLNGVNYDVAIYPRPIGFEYSYDDTRWLGLAITPQVVIDLKVTAFDSKREVIFERVYSSGIVNGKIIYIPMTGWENVNAATHETVSRLLSTAAEEIVSVLRQ